MAKGTPTAAQAKDTATNFGAPALTSTKASPTIMPGASMTKAPEGLAAGSGYWAPNKNLPAGVTAQWVPPSVSPVTASPTTQIDPRLAAARAMAAARGGWMDGGSSSDRGGYTTSGRGWSGNSSANSGYGMGGRNW